jgi:hypothetical protein
MNKPSFIEALKVKTTDSNEAAFDVDFPDLPLQWDSFKANDQDFFRSMFSGSGRNNNDSYESRVPTRTPSPLSAAGRYFPWRIARTIRRRLAPFFHFMRLPWACGVARSDVVPV